MNGLVYAVMPLKLWASSTSTRSRFAMLDADRVLSLMGAKY